MKIRSPALLKLGGLLGVSLIRSWMSTIDYRISFYDPTVDPFHPEYHGQKIFVLWHEYITLPIMVRSHCNLTLLLSQHVDAEILSQIARHAGFDCVRGSTSRGSIGALEELCRCSAQMNLVITPDGPRGPRRRMSQGPIFLASRLGLPIVAIGIGLDRPWRLQSWDRFAIARPGSRARAVIGPEMYLPSDLNRQGIEHYRQQVDRMLSRLTLESEAWAEAGGDKLDSIPVRKDYHRERADRLRIDSSQSLVGPRFRSTRGKVMDHVSAREIVSD